MVIPQPMSQKNPDFEPLSPSYVENTGSRAPAVGPMGGAGPKRRRKKTLKFVRKSPKTKKIELGIKMCGISSEITWQLFFSILDPF